MANFYNMFFNFMLVGLVMLGIFAFAITFQEENSVDDKITQNSLINSTFTDLQTSLGGLSNKSQTQKNVFEREVPAIAFGGVLLFSIVSSGKVFNSMVVGVWNLFIKLPAVVLGVDPIVISVLGAVLILTIIIGLWQLYKVGG